MSHLVLGVLAVEGWCIFVLSFTALFDMHVECALACYADLHFVCHYAAALAKFWSCLQYIIQSINADNAMCVCSEIQPLETRAAACSFNVAVNMLFTFVIGQCFVTMLCSMQWGVFLFFAGKIISPTA